MLEFLFEFLFDGFFELVVEIALELMLGGEVGPTDVWSSREVAATFGMPRDTTTAGMK